MGVRSLYSLLCFGSAGSSMEKYVFCQSIPSGTIHDFFFGTASRMAEMWVKAESIIPI